MKCVSFDLQAVIYLPKCLESATFHKRGFQFKLTFYDIDDKNCHCFVWHEGVSKRGASEIQQLYTKLLCFTIEKGLLVLLYANECAGQNKNSIMPTMMLHIAIASKNPSRTSIQNLCISTVKHRRQCT